MPYSLNRVQLIGNLGQDPEAIGPDGEPIGCRLNVATKETWKDRDGNRQERTEWHRVTVFGNRGHACREHLRKGAPVYVEGRIETRKYQAEDGSTRYSTEVIASDVGFLPSRQGPVVVTSSHERRPGDRPSNRPQWERKR